MDRPVNIALPKGRLGEKALSLFKEACITDIAIDQDSRKLFFDDVDGGLRFILVKPSDCAVYVERGAADIGVCGSDILMEQGTDVFELLDLGFGNCSMCVAAPKGFTDGLNGPLRVATKYVNSAEEYFSSKGRDIDVVKLNGSIELAPILGLSDVIFDIVETGGTLKENDLEVIERAFDISARFIANRSSYNFMYEKIKEITDKLSAASGG